MRYQIEYYDVTCLACGATYTQRLPWGAHPPVICGVCGDDDINADNAGTDYDDDDDEAQG
jgi:hypothetical protein